MRRIKRAKVTCIALCPRGKNGLQTLFKSDDGSVELAMLTKEAEDGELLSVVYAPNRPDADGHYMLPEDIKSMAYEYQRDHRQLDVRHDGKILKPSDAYVAESFIVAPGDERFAGWKDYDGEDVGDLTGSWATVTKIESPELRKAYRDGEWDGVSLWGKGELEPLHKEDTDDAVRRVLKSLLKGSDDNTNEETMNEELKKMLEGITTSLAKMDERMEKLEKADDKGGEGKGNEEELSKSDDMPKFEGDPLCKEDRAAHALAVRTHVLTKALDAATAAGDFDKVEEILAKMDALGGEGPTDEEVGIAKEDTPRERKLKRELFDLRKARSEQSTGEDEPSNKTTTSLSKALEGGRDRARRIANRVNGVVEKQTA